MPAELSAASATASAWRATVATPLYRKAWGLGTLPHLGYWIVILTFQGIIAQQTDSDPLLLGLFYFVTLLPFLLVSLHAGVWADRFNRVRLLVIAHLLILVVSASVSVLILTGRTTPLTFMVGGFVFGLAMAVSQPAGQSLVAESVPRNLMVTAVTLHGFGVTLSRFVGPALAAVSIAMLGTGLTMLAHGGLCLSIAALALATRSKRRSGEKAVSLGRAAIRSGLSHAKARWPVTASLLAVAVLSLFGASYLSQMASLGALTTAGDTWFAVLMSATGLGALGGVVLAALPSPPQRDIRRICGSLLGLGLAVAALGWVRSPGAQLLLVLAASACQFTTLTLGVRVIQASIADSHRGRVMSLYQLCYAGLIPVGGLLLGATWSWAGPHVAFSSVGAVVAGSAIAMGVRFWSLDPSFPLERRIT